MKYKLNKQTKGKLQGDFTLGKTYNGKEYFDNFWVMKDDRGKEHIFNIKKPDFENYFLCVNKERKQKLEHIERKNHENSL